MDVILLVAAGNIESAGCNSVVDGDDEGGWRVLSGLQVEDNGVKQGRPNSTSITVFAVNVVCRKACDHEALPG